MTIQDQIMKELAYIKIKDDVSKPAFWLGLLFMIAVIMLVISFLQVTQGV